MSSHPGLLSKGCPSGKPRFDGAEKARAAAIPASKRARVPLSYYECPACGGWHLTKSVGGANPRLDQKEKKP